LYYLPLNVSYYLWVNTLTYKTTQLSAMGVYVVCTFTMYNDYFKGEIIQNITMNEAGGLWPLCLLQWTITDWWSYSKPMLQSKNRIN
jgi:hypothetical protein